MDDIINIRESYSVSQEQLKLHPFIDVQYALSQIPPPHGVKENHWFKVYSLYFKALWINLS